jgi:polyribonucleotide nucleotidyltransferase
MSTSPRKEQHMSFETPGLISLAHNSDKWHEVSIPVDGDEPMRFEVGRVAKQAAGAVWARWGDSIVLVTVCGAQAREGIDFFPLTVEYIEKTYAAGKIPGGFFKREARLRDSEILNCRIIDRSLRPLFPEGYKNDVQIIATVVSFDGQHDTDVLALSAASMAVHISSIPFGETSGPIAGVRVGRMGGTLVANPTFDARSGSDLDLVVSVSKDAIVMVEGGAAEVSESDLVDALFFAHKEGQKVIAAIHEMREKMGKPKASFTPPAKDEALYNKVHGAAEKAGLTAALATRNKIERYAALDKAKESVHALLKAELGDESYTANKKKISEYYGDVKYNVMRQAAIATKLRLDGRKYDEIRPINCEVGALPRAHGSALFTRGETQAIVSTTLGTRDDEQKIDNLLGESYRRYMLHYNFPPFSVGEARAMRGTSRREIGHGALAERAVARMIPSEDEFPYVIRIVSEITESNGSSSMASVCGATMSLYDAGVPVKSPVAGIAMGLIKEGSDIAILSDILGDEDHLGDMDFKVCGTAKGVTAIQMDIKIDGLTREIMSTALAQAKAGRAIILKQMADAISGPRGDLSPWAPRMTTVRINPDKIRDVIGPGGKVIRDIVAKTGAKIDIKDDGTVTIAAVGREAGEKARQIIEDLTREAEVNRIYKGLVRKVVEFGAFVELFPGTDGLIHISELSDKRVAKVTDVVQEGDEVVVKVLSIDRDGKIRLSRRAAVGKEPGTIDKSEPPMREKPAPAAEA